jgi:ribosomal protein S3
MDYNSMGGGHRPVPFWSKEDAINYLLKRSELGEFDGLKIKTNHPGKVIGEEGRNIKPLSTFWGERIIVESL